MAQRYIMVIKDDAANLECMDDPLSLYDYKVTLTQTFIDAVRRIEELQPNLVVLGNRLDTPANGIDITR